MFKPTTKSPKLTSKHSKPSQQRKSSVKLKAQSPYSKSVRRSTTNPHTAAQPQTSTTKLDSPPIPPQINQSPRPRTRQKKHRSLSDLDLLPEQAPTAEYTRTGPVSPQQQQQQQQSNANISHESHSQTPPQSRPHPAPQKLAEIDTSIPKPSPRRQVVSPSQNLAPDLGSCPIPPQQPHYIYFEPPDEETIALATKDETSAESRTARRNILKYFRNAGRQSDLIKPSIDVPYLLPIGESSSTTYPIPEYLFHSLYHMSATTVANYGMGMSAPQLGLNYRAFVIRSEVFGHTSPITNIPYVLETSEKTHCMVPPRRMQRSFPKPLMFEQTPLAWDNPNPSLDNFSRPAVNLSKSMVDYHDVDGDISFINDRGGLIYHLQKNLEMPVRDEKQLNLCDDRILLLDDQPVEPVNVRSRAFGNRGTGNASKNTKIISNNSFINEYRGYSVPLVEIERPMFLPLLQAFQQQMDGTAVINPRVTQIRYEYASFREGCFSYPQWNLFVSRPIAFDVEFETIEVDGATIPQHVSPATFNSATLSAPLCAPQGSTLRYCPTLDKAGLDPHFVAAGMTKQLEISRHLPKPETVRLVTRKLTFRDLFAKVFLHEYDHLDGIQFFDRASGEHMSWQPPLRNLKAEPSAKYEFPVGIGKAYF